MDMDIILPPLPEQKAIAEVLSSLDDKIDLLARQNKTLEDLAQTYFRRWFVEDADEKLKKYPLSELMAIQNGFAFRSRDYQDAGKYNCSFSLSLRWRLKCSSV
jgi:type I restriction enzyme S subunit